VKHIELKLPQLLAELERFKASPRAFLLNLERSTTFGRTFVDENAEREWQGWISRAQAAADDRGELEAAVHELTGGIWIERAVEDRPALAQALAKVRGLLT
jgi:hypothetical protein